MRIRGFSVVLLLTLGLGTEAFGQSCSTGLATLSGVVYAPNGTDPLPNVTVYVPSLTQPIPLPAFTPGVSCPVPGAPPVGNPIAGAITGVNGSFTIQGVPVGTTIPVVAVAGKWRVQTTVTTTACTNTTVNLTMPTNQSQGDIPMIAIATGSSDSVECVLRKVGIADSEFTAPGGGGRINLFQGSASAGAAPSGTPQTQAQLMTNATLLNSYDVLMLPCQGTATGDIVTASAATEEANFVSFANAGGRVYSSHYSHIWMDYSGSPFLGVANWLTGMAEGAAIGDGLPATVNTNFSDGQTLAGWLPLVGASSATTPTQISLSAVKHDINGVNSPTQVWLTLNQTFSGDVNPVMQFVFDTPVGATSQCGKVLYNEYHVENPVIASQGKIFPAECQNTAMTPQEKLLEYSLFELTNDGGAPTMTPATQDFGTVAIGFPSAPQTFTWKNNSSFVTGVSSSSITGDFAITSNNCATVAAYSTCSIVVVFTPTVVGARTGTLSVVSNGTTLTGALTGTGAIGYTMTPATLNFGNVIIGVGSTQSLTLANVTSTSLPTPPFNTMGDYAVATNCGVNIAANGTCSVNVTFTPTTAGTRTGTLSSNASNVNEAGLTASLTGVGIDGLSLAPAALTYGSLDVGAKATQQVTVTNGSPGALPVPGFVATGDFTAVSTCSAMLASMASCVVNVTFQPTTSGPRTGTLSANSSNSIYGNLTAALSGTGLDFTFTLSPTSGSVVAGNSVKTTATLTPLGGFAAPVSITCSVTAPASTCTPAVVSQVPAGTANVVTIATTSQYAVVGYSGLGGSGWLWLVAIASGSLLWLRRRTLTGVAKAGLLALLLMAMSLSASGCSGKQPAKNSVYTTPGTYTYTLTATDGFLVHTATYALTVTEE
jgi:hypothetical protein